MSSWNLPQRPVTPCADAGADEGELGWHLESCHGQASGGGGTSEHAASLLLFLSLLHAASWRNCSCYAWTHYSTSDVRAKYNLLLLCLLGPLPLLRQVRWAPP